MRLESDQLFQREKAGHIDAELTTFKGAVDVVHGAVLEIDASVVPVCAELVKSRGKVSECTDECGADDLFVFHRDVDCGDKARGGFADGDHFYLLSVFVFSSA